MATQYKELTGDVPFGKGLYHSKAFEEMIQELKTNEEKIGQLKTTAQRLPFLEKQFKQWTKYVTGRLTELPEELVLTEKMKANINHAFEINKSRTDGNLHPNRVNEMHYDIANLFQFNPVIDVQFLEQMIHPARGYLNHLQSGISYPELIELYETLLVASHEKYIGQSILSHQISAYGFWNLIDKKRQGWLSFGQYLAVLKMVRFDRIRNPQDLHKEFGSHFKNWPVEMLAASDGALGFGSFKDIFVERNL